MYSDPADFSMRPAAKATPSLDVGFLGSDEKRKEDGVLDATILQKIHILFVLKIKVVLKDKSYVYN